MRCCSNCGHLPVTTRAQKREASGDWRIDWPAKVLVIICVLNLNGVVSMMFDQGGAVSLLMLGTASILVLAAGRRVWSLPFALLFLAIVSYLLFGALFYDPLLSVEAPGKYYRAYGGALLILWGLAGYVARLEPGPRLDGFLAFVRNVFLLSAASVWASPILYEYYVNLPFSFQQRMGGFFGNPNEAAMVSVLAVALTLALPFRSKLIQIAALAMAGTAVFMTFSKTGMVCLVIVLAWHLVRAARGIGLVILTLGMLAVILFLQDAEGILIAIVDSPMLDLDEHQRGRVLAVGQILSGQIDETTSTGRTYLWRLVIERALNDFPLGSGLGSAHHIIGGVLEHDAWQGAHNTFLMIWSESGVLPLLLLIAAMGSAALSSLRYVRSRLELTCLFVLLVNMIVSHMSLALRYHNVMLAIIFGLLAGVSWRYAKKRSRRRI